MTTKIASSEFKVSDTGAEAEAGYAAWKHNKVVHGLEQVKDRATLIPADQVWRNLGLER